MFVKENFEPQFSIASFLLSGKALLNFSLLVPSCLIALSSFAVADDLPDTFSHTITYDSESYTIDFSRFSSRGPLYEVVEQQSDGSFLSITPEEARTYIGTVEDQPGAVAVAVLRGNGETYVRLTFENGLEWLDYDGTVRAEDSLGTITVEDHGQEITMPDYVVRDGGAGSDLYAADMFIDLPYSYYETFGSTDRLVELVDFSMTGINMLYMRDANVINRIGRVQIRADEDQNPYSSNVITDLLTQVKIEGADYVQADDSTSDHDLGTVIYGPATGGVANVGVVGTGFSANRASSYNNGDFTQVSRHEFGHNWGLTHYDGGKPEGATINSGNTLGRMSGPELEALLTERDSALDVLDNLGTSAPSLPPRASDDSYVVTNILNGQTLTVSPLLNDNDSNGESFFITSVDATSTEGADVVIGSDGETIEITFPSDYDASYDHFAYQIEDESGRTSTANVHLNLESAAMDWETMPTPISEDSLLMIGSDKFEGDDSELEYYFEHVNGTQSSEWQSSRTYIATGLTAYEENTFRVYARIVDDSSNESEPSEDVSVTIVPVSEGVLLTDDFSRTEVNDSTGQSEQIAPVNYSIQSFSDSTVDILSDQLRIEAYGSDGSYGGLVYIDDFNFASPMMSVFNEVHISFDIAGYSTVGSSRQIALSIGQSLSELEAQEGADPQSSSADLTVAYRYTTDELEIYKAGNLDSLESVTGLTSPTTELELIYWPAGMTSESLVSYEVYLGGVFMTSGSFTWSGSYENYISLSANLTEDALIDNLKIEVMADEDAVVDDVWDTEAPQITLLGAETLNLTVGDVYTESGATAYDETDGDLTDSIVITGSVDTTEAGTYTLIYSVTDSEGNEATTVTRTVIVSDTEEDQDSDEDGSESGSSDNESSDSESLSTQSSAMESGSMDIWLMFLLTGLLVQRKKLSVRLKSCKNLSL
jgi:hypothetical protein